MVAHLLRGSQKLNLPLPRMDAHAPKLTTPTPDALDLGTPPEAKDPQGPFQRFAQFRLTLTAEHGLCRPQIRNRIIDDSPCDSPCRILCRSVRSGRDYFGYRGQVQCEFHQTFRQWRCSSTVIGASVHHRVGYGLRDFQRIIQCEAIISSILEVITKRRCVGPVTHEIFNFTCLFIIEKDSLGLL